MAQDLNIMLGVPHNGTITYAAAQGIFRASQKNKAAVCAVANSALAHGFNQILGIALNAFDRGEVTHLAFLHSDIDPQDCWVDVLADEMEATGTEFISVVNAIKDMRGVTSSGISKADDPWHAFRRFTVNEVCKLPETFTAADAGYADDVLLHNTGCWLADLRAPCFHELDEKGYLRAYFTLNDRLFKTADGWRCEFEPEDWFFSRRLHELGAKTCITRKVRTSHLGWLGYLNNQPWGSYTNGDEDTAVLWRPSPGEPIEDESGSVIGTCATAAEIQESELCLTR